MKQILSLVITLCALTGLQAQTVDEVIAKYYAAAGGKEKLEAITSLQYVQAISIQSPQGNFDMNIVTIREKNKLFRTQMSNELMGESFAVVTDTATWVRKPANPFTNEEGGLEKIKAADMKGIAVAQLDCAGFFPELVNYGAKGYTAELTGSKKINGRDSYKVKLKKDKAKITYFIEKETGLVC